MGEEAERQRIRAFSVTVYDLRSEATPIKSQQHDLTKYRLKQDNIKIFQSGLGKVLQKELQATEER